MRSVIHPLAVRYRIPVVKRFDIKHHMTITIGIHCHIYLLHFIATCKSKRTVRMNKGHYPTTPISFHRRFRTDSAANMITLFLTIFCILVQPMNSLYVPALKHRILSPIFLKVSPSLIRNSLISTNIYPRRLTVMMGKIRSGLEQRKETATPTGAKLRLWF